MKLLINKFLNWFLIIFLSLTSTNSYVFAQNIDQFALPTGGQVVSGNIDINQPSVGRLDVNQTTQQGIVNWNTFNVGSSASVYFNQPTNKSTILNNVVSGKSIINGSIFSNGRLILVNPTGILMGPTSAVRAEGAILSTLNITNQNFLNDNLSFSTDKLSKLTASGKIDAQYVALISPEINNKGQIIAKASTALAAGDDVLLSISGSNKLTVKVKPSKLKSLAKNEGTIETKNGIVTIKADAAQSLVDETIKITDAKAQGLVSENGVIKLVSNTGSIEASEIKIDAGSKGEATISGKLDVNSSTGKGGDIEIAGKELNVVSAKLSADGKEGGGKILIGGDWQGKGDLLQSTYTSIDKNSVLSASAIESGAGGTIVAWSNIKDSNSVTSVYGTLTAKGIDGDGGQIETSGAVLNYNGIKVDTSSETGNYGSWLLDPTNLTVGSSEASTYVSNLASTNVNVTADNTITVNSAISYGGGRSNGTLTFTSASTVLNANVGSSSNSLNVVFASAVKLGADVTINTRGGDLTLNSTLDSNTSTAKGLTVSGSSGSATFGGNIGSTYRLSGIDVTAGTINIGGNISTDASAGTYSTSSLGAAGWIRSDYNGYFGEWNNGHVNDNTNLFNNNPTATHNVTSIYQGDPGSYKSYRYEGYFKPNASGSWRLQVGADDSVISYVGNAGQTIASLKSAVQNSNRFNHSDKSAYLWSYRPGRHGVQYHERDRTFTANEVRPFLYFWGEATGGAAARMRIRNPSNQWSGWTNNYQTGGATVFYRSYTSENVSSANDDIRLNGNVVLTSNSTIDANNDSITFTGTVNGNSSGRNLVVDAGTDNVTFSGAVGGSTALNNITVNGAALSAAAVTASGDVSVTNSGTSTISGVIAANSFTKAGAGQLTFKPSNATGSITLNAGSAVLSADSQMNNLSGSANINISSNDITLNNSSSTTYSGVLSGSGNLIKTGNETITLSGTNTYSGNTTISAGTLSISGRLGSGTYSGTIANSGIFSYTSSSAQTISGAISGSGQITKSGASTLTLSGTNTYSGGTTISAGAITVSGLLGNGSYAGSISNAGTLTLSSSSAQTLSGAISGSGGITKSGSGNLTLSGNSNFTGAVTLSTGTLIAAANNSLGSSPSINSSASKVLQLSEGVTLPSLAVTGAISLESDITTTGAQSYSAATVIGASSGSAVTLATTNSDITFSDNVNIYQNTSINTGSGAGNVTFGGTLGSVSGGTARNLIVNAGAGDVTFSGNIKGGSAVTSTYLTSSTHTTAQNGSNPYTISKDLGSDWTYEAKYNSSGWSGNLNTIFSYGHYTKGILIRSPNRGDSFYVRGQNQGALDLFGQGSNGTAGNWRTVKVTYNNNIAKVYVDGSLTSNGTNAKSSGSVINPTTKTIMIGRAHHASSEGLAATIKDITIVTDASDSGVALNDLTVTGAAISASGEISVDGDISITNSGTSTLSGIISGSNNVAKSGTGTLNLSGVNTYTGTTTVNAGKLKVSGSGKLGSGSYSANIINTGTFEYGSSAAQTLSGTISGSGAVVSSGSGAVTLSGTNTYTGTTTITGGGNLVGGNIAAFGGVLSPTIISNSTSDQFSLASGISLAGLRMQGPVRLNSGITTAGAQNYTGNVLVAAGSKASPVEFTTTNSNINFGGTLKGQGNAKNRSMTVNAGTGNVIYGDRVGYAFNLETVDPTNTADSFYKMTTTANTITLKGDVMTYEEQVYNGDVLIGSSGSNGTTRTVLSMDPKVIFNGKVNDTVKGKHSLIAKAVEIDRGVNAVPTVQFNSTVGSIKALKSYTGLTGFQVSGARWGTINPSSAFGTRIGVGQKMTGGVVNSATNEKAKMAAKTAARASEFKPINDFGRGPLNFNSFRGGNSFGFAKSLEIVYADNPSFGDMKARPEGNNFDIGKPLAKGSVEGNNPSGQGFFGKLFGSPKGNPTDFKPANMETAKDFNAPPKQFKDIKDLFKTFEGKPQKGEFFNPYKLGSKPKQRVENKPQAQNKKSSNNTISNSDAIIEDEENN